LQLRQIVIGVDADDERHALGGDGGRRKGQNGEDQAEEKHDGAAHRSLP